MTFVGCPLDEVSVNPAGIISDHGLVVSRLSVAVGHAAAAERLVRGWRRVDRDHAVVTHSSIVPSANQSLTTHTSTSCSLSMTACSVTSPTASPHNTPYVSHWAFSVVVRRRLSHGTSQLSSSGASLSTDSFVN